MRSYVLPFALILSVGAAGAAMASTTSTGVVKSVDMKTHTLTLADGTSYMLPHKFKDPGLKAGEKVTILWDKKGKNHEVAKVTIDK